MNQEKKEPFKSKKLIFALYAYGLNSVLLGIGALPADVFNSIALGLAIGLFGGDVATYYAPKKETPINGPEGRP